MSKFANDLFTVLGALGEAAIASKHFSDEEKDLIAKTEQMLRSKGHLEEAEALKELMNRYYVSSTRTTTPNNRNSNAPTPYEAKKKILTALEKVGYYGVDTIPGYITNNIVRVVISTKDGINLRVYKAGFRKIDETSETLATIHVSPEFRIIDVDEDLSGSPRYLAQMVRESVDEIVKAITTLQ